VKVFTSIDSVKSDGESDRIMYPEEFLNGLNPSGFPPHTLRLKPGMPIMLLRNLDQSSGDCNGSR